MSTGAVVARTSRNLINRRGPILHVATELKNVGQRGYLANLVHRVASQQISTGLDARVVLPHSPELDLSQLEDIDDQGTHLQGTFDGIPVYVLKHSEEVEHCFSAVYPTGEDALQDYLHFGKVFWQMVGEEVFGDTPLVHLWDHTAGWMAGQRPMALGRVRTVFTPVEPETHFQDFPLDQIEEYAGQADLFGFRTVSGFMVGFEHADVITEWHRGFFGQLKKNVPVLNPFLTPFLKRGNVHSLRCAGWRPVQETELPSACIDALNEAYYQALYGTGYDFSIQVADAPMTDVDALLVSAVEKHPEDRRSPLLVRRMKQEHPDIGRIEAVTRYVARYLGEVIQGFRGNVGGVVQMLKNIDENPDTNPQGLYFAFLNGGDGERGFVTTLASCVKGELVLGSRTIGAISQDSAAMVGRQLPAGENGWVVIFGCDNYLLPNGPLRVGNQLLAKAKQGIVLFGHSEKLVGRSASEVDYLKGLGVFFTDAQTGEITAFREKMMTPRGDFDLDAATEMLSEHGGERVYKNTYFFAMRQDVAAAWYKGFERPSVLDGRPLHESYDIDFSNHFTLACLSSKDEWIALYKARDKRAKAFAEGDWMFLWEHAQKIKELAGGIAGADIGSGEDTWSDIGTIEAFYSRLARILSSNQVIRRVTRFMLGRLPENESVHNSNVAGVETPEDESFFVGNTVFRKGGKIGKNVIIIGSIFEDYVEIPDNTIIIGSRVHNISFQEGDRSRKLIYSLHQDSLDPTLDIRGNCAHSTMFLINGQKQTGVFPIALGGKEVRADEMGRPAKDRLLAWYDMDGSMVTQPIMGMPQTTDARLIDRLLRFGTDPAVAHVASVKNLKRISSLGRTEQAERRLAADIQTAL